MGHLAVISHRLLCSSLNFMFLETCLPTTYTEQAIGRGNQTCGALRKQKYLCMIRRMQLCLPNLPAHLVYTPQLCALFLALEATV